MEREIRYAPAEFRQAEGGNGGLGMVAGVVVKYGDTAILPFGRERIVAGAFAPLPTNGVRANVQHDRRRALAVLGRGLAFEDSPTELRASITLPDTTGGRDAAVLFREGVLTGLSLEMAVAKERRENGVRVVLRAAIVGLGMVDDPAYQSSVAALRQAVEGPDWASRPDWW